MGHPQNSGFVKQVLAPPGASQFRQGCSATARNPCIHRITFRVAPIGATQATSVPNCVAPNGANIWWGAYHRGSALARYTPAYNLPPLAGLISGNDFSKMTGNNVPGGKAAHTRQCGRRPQRPPRGRLGLNPTARRPKACVAWGIGTLSLLSGPRRGPTPAGKGHAGAWKLKIIRAIITRPAAFNFKIEDGSPAKPC